MFAYIAEVLCGQTTPCEDNWMAFNGSCYLVGHDHLHYIEAQVTLSIIIFVRLLVCLFFFFVWVFTPISMFYFGHISAAFDPLNLDN